MIIDWTHLYKNYKGLWVALKSDEITVVGSGKTIKSAMAEAKKNGYSNPIFNYIPKKDVAFVGFKNEV